MQRPDHLPDFDNPPLNEVVLGVQFTPMPSFNSTHMGDVWNLYRREFPIVQEYPPLQPTFETFGGQNLQAHSFQLHLGGGPIGSRVWFVSEEKNRLLQFQPDRFLTNWRKNSDGQHYPRFENIADAYQSDLRALAAHFKKFFDRDIEINQVELTYINIIQVKDFSQAGNLFSLWNNILTNIEGMSVNFSEVIEDRSGKPFARFSHSIQSLYSSDGAQKAFNFSLMFRGKPATTDIDAALEFLRQARDAIVMRFDEITTDHAHKIWGKRE